MQNFCGQSRIQCHLVNAKLNVSILAKNYTPYKSIQFYFLNIQMDMAIILKCSYFNL
jgi:hypothetical protein